MKKLLTILLLSTLIVSCKSADDTPPVNATSGANFIDDNRENLGELANYLLDNYDFIAAEHKVWNPGLNAGSDHTLVYTLRSFVNTMVFSQGGNGLYDISNKTGIEAIEDLNTVQTESASVKTLCILLAEIYESFGVPARLVDIQGTPSAHFPDGTHSVVEIYYLDAWVIVDPKLDYMYLISGDPSFDNTRAQGFVGISDITSLSNFNFLEWLPQGSAGGSQWVALPGSYDGYSSDRNMQNPAVARLIAQDLWANGSFVITNYQDLNRP